MSRSALIALSVTVCASAQSPDAPGFGSVMGGWQVFARKQCIACHAVWGLGGQVGPDLGRTDQHTLTAAQLAGTMWNHIPKMQSHMLRNRLEYPKLSGTEMGDLFSFLLFVPYLDEPGDPAVGERLLRERNCARCHATEGQAASAAPDLRRWAAYANPVVWAHKMWEHAPKMEQAMREAGMNWPSLNDTDLLNIVAYLRSIDEHETRVYLEPGSPPRGARLFAEHSCKTCHHAGGAGGDLTERALPRSLASLASRMWNHSPEMTRLMQSQGIERDPLTAQEMADIIAFIITLQSEDRGGDAQRGRAVFQDKRCGSCHPAEPAGGAVGPTMAALGTSATPVRLADAMWNHGVTMMDRMSEAGISWPVFQGSDMVDVIAYLRSVAPAPAMPSPPPPPAPAVPLSRPPPIEAGSGCVTNACHPNVLAGREVHAPVLHGDCVACHSISDAQSHRVDLLSDRSDLCYRCHEDRGEGLAGHGPVAVGVCTACHNPHSADNLLGPASSDEARCFADMIGMTLTLEALRSAPAAMTPDAMETPAPDAPSPAEPIAGAVQPAPPAPSPPLAMSSAVAAPTRLGNSCVTSDCHPNVLSGRFVHGPTAQQACNVCHLLKDETNHRFEMSAPSPALCYECHDRPEEAAFTHGPVAMGMCTACHDPHSAPNEHLLPAVGNDLCFICHAEMQEFVRQVRAPHRAVTENGCGACHDAHRSQVRFQLKKNAVELCLDCHPDVGQLVSVAAVRHEPVDDDRKCANCHNPHGSDVPMILNDVEMNLCLSCHNKPMDTPNGPIIDMASWIRDNPERHGPIRDGNCTGCHQPHGSSHFRLLQSSFPRQFYRPFSPEVYELCFQCHEQTLVLDPLTTTLTGFRNGDKNLHYIHVNQEKGRTCRACHEIHAGTKPKRIKDTVLFGQWEYPLNFEQTEYGGRCAPGCHAPREYDRRREIVQK